MASIARRRSGPRTVTHSVRVVRRRPGAAPHEASGVVIGHTHQLAVSFAGGDLTDPDAHESICAVAHALLRGARRRPVLVMRPTVAQSIQHHVGDDALGSGAYEPHTGVLERPGDPRSGPGPGHGLGADPALTRR